MPCAAVPPHPPQVDRQPPADHVEEVVGFVMLVPYERALDLDDPSGTVPGARWAGAVRAGG